MNNINPNTGRGAGAGGAGSTSTDLTTTPICPKCLEADFSKSVAGIARSLVDDSAAGRSLAFLAATTSQVSDAAGASQKAGRTVRFSQTPVTYCLNCQDVVKSERGPLPNALTREELKRDPVKAELWMTRSERSAARMHNNLEIDGFLDKLGGDLEFEWYSAGKKIMNNPEYIDELIESDKAHLPSDIQAILNRTNRSSRRNFEKVRQKLQQGEFSLSDPDKQSKAEALFNEMKVATATRRRLEVIGSRERTDSISRKDPAYFAYLNSGKDSGKSPG